MSTYDTDPTPNEEIDAAADAAAELSDDQLEDVAGGWSGPDGSWPPPVDGDW